MLEIEKTRLNIQSKLDNAKDQTDKNERNKLGQFATPTILACEIVTYGLTLTNNNGIKFLDPAFGTGAFYSALLNISQPENIACAKGIEIDIYYAEPACELWSAHPLELEIADFTKIKGPDNNSKANVLICNPPYVRHHHIPKEDKKRLCDISSQVFKMKASGLSGLYCHFIALAHQWMEAQAIAGWLVPSEFMDVNYGKALKNYLCSEVTLLRIHRYDPEDPQFNDALVSSCVVWFKNTLPSPDHKAEFSFGGTMKAPKILKSIALSMLKKESKWTRFPLKDPKERVHIPKISDFFRVRRGLATGNNDFFIMTPNKAKDLNIPAQFLKPILPSPRHLSVKEVESESDGTPKITNNLVLIDCHLKPEEVEKNYPSLWRYLRKGVEQEVNKAYLCKNRSIWYKQENREPSPFYCTYIGRKTKASDKPFNFVLNHSAAVVTNSYLALEPLPKIKEALASDLHLRKKVWVALNAICVEQMKEEGRVYGGGMHKMEPKELANVPAAKVAELLCEHFYI